ncbi:cytochrome C assembly family protein [Agarilytica rhodophyticola]|uniref:cytochrome C assembly family protein n=1 Tax=Agarilytica rhodophyticola TaxID=1737490 RepID=UPI001FE6B71D|nr:cytochrome c biogenesis protein CcsA [Agarilytica rhodophyticola]
MTISFYTAAWAYILNALMRRQNIAATKVLAVIASGLVAHAIAVYFSLVKQDGLELGFFKIASLFFFVINLLVLMSSLRKPLHNLFVFLMPLSIMGLIVGEFFNSPVTSGSQLSPGIVAHILLSILAYSLLTIASMQALLLSYQNKQLKSKQFNGLMSIMPPLQTMESLLFDIVRAGFLFLTLSVITGIIYIDDIFVQKLSHKTVFSLLSWIIYAVLLTGHQIYGWRGAAAIRWVLGGFVALMLAYFGSKLVIEVILGSS